MMGIDCARSNTQRVFVRSSTLTIEELEQSSERVAAATESDPVYIRAWPPLVTDDITEASTGGHSDELPFWFVV